MFKKRLLRTFIFILCIILMFFSLNEVQADLYKKRNKIGIVYWHGDAEQNKISLTFDDGPNPIYTPKILDILKEYNIKATFFLIGKNVEAFPEIAKRIAQENHSIGNHTYSHPELLLKKKEQIRYQIKKAEEAIIKATGIKPHLFRPPYGLDDPAVFLEVEKLGYAIVKWSVSAGNGRKDPEAEKITQKILSTTKNGAIILMHDGERLIRNVDRSQLVKALPIIIKTLKQQGYEFVTIDELLGLN